MVRGQKKRQVLSASEVKALRQEQKETQAMLNQATEWGDNGRLDRATLQRQVDNLGKAIERGAPRKLRAGDKDKMAKRARELEESFKQGMPTYDEMWDLKHNPGAPEKNLNWQKRNAASISEYKQIMRELEPGDPTASNVEKHRRRS